MKPLKTNYLHMRKLFILKTTLYSKLLNSLVFLSLLLSPPTWASGVIADFTADTTFVMAGDSVSYTNLSSDSIIFYKWAFTGGKPGQSFLETPPAIQYNFPGIYNVMLIVSDGNSSDTLIKQQYITVLNNAADTFPKADFTANKTTIVEGSNINFDDLSLGMPKAWKWEFEGAVTTQSNLQNPQDINYLIPGIYDVTLISSNANGADTLVRYNYITVLSDSVDTVLSVDFSVYNAILYTGDSVYFYDLSLGKPNKWEWSFPGGTPSQSSDKNPIIAYNTAGQYNVSLTVTDTVKNLSQSMTIPNLVSVKDSIFTPITSINSVNESMASITIYPNPAKDIINISILNPEYDEVQITMHNIMGQEVFTTTCSSLLPITMDMKNREDGIYMLTILIGNRCFLHKAIIDKK
jgi:PKD repeat protein